MQSCDDDNRLMCFVITIKTRAKVVQVSVEMAVVAAAVVEVVVTVVAVMAVVATAVVAVVAVAVGKVA